MYVHLSTRFSTSDCCSLILVEQFEKDDDPEAGLDESFAATYGCEEMQTPQAGASVNYSLTSEFSLLYPLSHNVHSRP